MTLRLCFSARVLSVHFKCYKQCVSQTGDNFWVKVMAPIVPIRVVAPCIHSYAFGTYFLQILCLADYSVSVELQTFL